MSVESKVCLVCGKPCIARCPCCLALVHFGYGFNNEACSLKHEDRCEGARLLRSGKRESSPPCDTTKYVTVDELFTVKAKPRKNGAHSKPIRRRK